MHSSRPSALSRLLVSGSLLLGLGFAVPAHADLVILTDGEVMKVSAFEASGDLARLTMASGGRMTMAIDRVDRVIEDEVIPEPDPPKKAVEVVADAVKAALVPLHFEEAKARVPDGPTGR